MKQLCRGNPPSVPGHGGSGEGGFLDSVIPGDCLETLRGLPEACASLVFTSPPYNVGMPYQAGGDGAEDGEMTVEGWVSWLGEIWQECVRVLRPGGRLVVNVLDGNGRSPYVPTGAMMTLRMAALEGAQLFGKIVWRKAAAANGTAWGSWLSASCPSLRDVHEVLIGAVKLGGPLKPRKEGATPDIQRDDFLRDTASIWSVLPASAKTWHPCPFPVELVRRAVQLWTYPGDVVLDPFMGSGTTGVAARALGRHWIGCELDGAWAKKAQQRIKGAGFQKGLFPGADSVVG